jgi:hypothetical protein
MSVDLSTLINFLSAISSIAVILGAIFVVFQLRQNAKLIQLTIRENRSNIALALLEKITARGIQSRVLLMKLDRAWDPGGARDMGDQWRRNCFPIWSSQSSLLLSEKMEP